MTAHNVRLTEMRISDHVVMLKSVSKARNPIIERRSGSNKCRYVKMLSYVGFIV